MKAIVNGAQVMVGNRSLLESYTISQDIDADISQLEKNGRTVLIVSINGEIAGMVGVSDVIRSSSKDAVFALKEDGYRCHNDNWG